MTAREGPPGVGKSVRKITGAVLGAVGADEPYRHSAPLSIRELDIEPPGAYELLVRIESAGICHSDLSVVNGSRPRPLPLLLGHEAAGRIVATGSHVGDVAAGQRVTMTFLPRCGLCAECATDGRTPCPKGSQANGAGTLLGGGGRLSVDGAPVHHHNGVSAFATHAVVDRRSVVPVDDDVPPDVAALLGCAVLTGGGAVLNVARPVAGDTVMVVGLGGVGMAAVLVGAAVSGVRVIGVDVERSKLAIAQDLGADEVYTPDEVRASRLRVTHAVEAAGHPSALELAFDATAPGGRTVTVGLPHPSARISLPAQTITTETRTIVGSYLGSSVPSRDIPHYVQLWRDGRLPIEKLISTHIRLEEINEALDALAAGSVLRQMVEFP